MFKVIFDNRLNTTQATDTREETAYLRGTVVEVEAGLEALKGARIRLYADQTPEAIGWAGKAMELSAIPGKPVKYEDSEQLTYNLHDVEQIAELPAAYKAKMKRDLAIAAMAAGAASGPRVISRKVPGSFAEAAGAGESNVPVAAGDEL